MQHPNTRNRNSRAWHLVAVAAACVMPLNAAWAGLVIAAESAARAMARAGRVGFIMAFSMSVKMSVKQVVIIVAVRGRALRVPCAGSAAQELGRCPDLPDLRHGGQ